MRTLNKNEVKQVDGAWLHVAVMVAKAAWTGYRYYKSAKNASLAAQAAAHIGGATSLVGITYSTAKTFGP